LKQENGIGFETRNGVMRCIKETDGDAQAQVKATTKVMAGIKFGLNLLNGTLMDASIRAGAEGVVKTTLHLYDEEGNMTDQVSNLPADLIEKAAADEPNILLCTDINAHWLVTAVFNSSDSAAGKIGLTKEYDLLDEENAPLIPGLNHHFENGQAVEKCTRTARKYLPTADGITTARHICLKEYSFAVKAGDIYEITVEALPEGYEKEDLIYESSHSEIASVDDIGCVFGRQPGSTVISVRTKDQKHIIHCNVIVPEN
jgi:hypothetical protein